MGEASPFRCCKCGTNLHEHSGTVWQQVIGWEHKRDAGGTNHVAMREPQDTFMCNTCMTLLRNGLSTEQTSLL